jgi:hypothetical protein
MTTDSYYITIGYFEHGHIHQDFVLVIFPQSRALKLVSAWQRSAAKGIITQIGYMCARSPSLRDCKHIAQAQ